MSKTKTKGKRSEDPKPSILARFHFKDTRRQFTIDALDLTFEEQAIVEEHFNRPWPFLMELGWIGFSSKGKVVLGYLARRRKEPDFTLEDAYANLKKVEATPEGGDADPPTGDSSGDGSQS